VGEVPGDVATKPVALPLSELCHRFLTEVVRYRCRQPSDDRFAYELLRRAIVEGDPDSWQVLFDGYHFQVLAWCRRADAGASFEPAELVALTWEKFWCSFTARHFVAATGVAAILHYLQVCAGAAVVDLARATARASRHTVPLDAVIGKVCGYCAVDDGLALDDGSRAALWQIVAGALKSEREAAVVELLFQRGLRSVEVPLWRPDLFASAAEVYSVTRNLLDRLRRNHALRAWLEREELVHCEQPPRSRRR
jgi:hypothetical protein